MRTERSSGPGTDQATAPAPSRHALFRAAVRDPGILALVLGYAVIVVILTATPHGSWKPTLFWAVQIPSDALFFYASRYIARHGCRDDKARRFWRLTAFAAGAFVTGDILRTVEGVLGIEHNDAGPVQTICFVVGQTAFIIALVGYPVAGTGSARHRFLLDGAIVVCGAGSVVWYLLADTPGGESGDVFNGLIVGAQVLMVGFLSVKLVLSGYSPVIRPAAASMIAAGLVTAVVTAILPLYADRITLGESLAIQLLPTLLIAAGPRLQVIHLVIDLTDEPTKRRRPYSLLPYGAVALVHGLTLYEVNTHRVIHLRGVGLLGAVAITTLLVVWRQLLSVGENAQLIRELDRSLLELAHEKDRFSSLVAHSSDITLVVTRDQRITYASPAAERILGLRPEQLVGNQLADFVHPADFERIAPEMEALLSVPCRVVTVQARLRTMGGRWRWLEAVNTNLLDDPSVNGIVCNCRDVTDARHFQQQLIHQASHDVLTQLANRRLFTERLTAAQCDGRGEQVALLMIDLDGFKPINDTYGHHVGDAVLVAVAERIRRCIRPTDTAARLGGDEFAVLLPASTLEQANRVAERFEGVLAEPVAVGEHRLVVGASIGVTVGSAVDPEALVRDADAQMYRIKYARRDAERSGAPV